MKHVKVKQNIQALNLQCIQLFMYKKIRVKSNVDLIRPAISFLLKKQAGNLWDEDMCVVTCVKLKQ